jgi:hypothetical protein
MNYLKEYDIQAPLRDFYSFAQIICQMKMVRKLRLAQSVEVNLYRFLLMLPTFQATNLLIEESILYIMTT